MCGRIVAGDKTQAEMLEILSGYIYPNRPWRAEDAAQATTGYNVAPTQLLNLLFLDGDEVVASSARWWLVPHWHRKPIAEWKATTFNAKLETARGLPSFRDAWSQGRCVVPVLGYYEWSGPKTNRQPNYIRLEQNQPYMLLAGLQTRLANGLRTCTILTRAALPEIKEIHARMPVALTSDEAEHWLDHDVGDEEIIARYGLGIQGRLQHHRVAKFGSRDDDVSLIDSIDGFL